MVCRKEVYDVKHAPYMQLGDATHEESDRSCLTRLPIEKLEYATIAPFSGNNQQSPLGVYINAWYLPRSTCPIDGSPKQLVCTGMHVSLYSFGVQSFCTADRDIQAIADSRRPLTVLR